MSAASTETSAPLPTAGSRVFFQPPSGVGCVGSGPITPADDPVQKRQGKVTVKYDRKELRKRLVLEEWIIEQLSELYDCEVSGARAPVTSPLPSPPDKILPRKDRMKPGEICLLFFFFSGHTLLFLPSTSFLQHHPQLNPQMLLVLVGIVNCGPSDGLFRTASPLESHCSCLFVRCNTSQRCLLLLLLQI